jgi:hypothetical protein
MNSKFDLSKYYVTHYEHIDDFRCHRPLVEAFEDLIWTDEANPKIPKQREDKLRASLVELFKTAGWEGDGEIGCIFIAPPFSSRGWTTCEVIFHVKQSNNGTSFLAIPHGFKPRLPET